MCSMMKASAFLVLSTALMGCGGGHAPTPAAFDKSVTLQGAVDKAAAAGKPVLVFATADWCGPCQSFKRGALASDKVTRAITSKTVPVLIDVTSAQTAPPGSEKLGIQGIPVLIMYKNGAETARLVGGVGEAELLAWLDAAAK
jgi:thiol:disulfide interchange protein